MNNQFRIGDKVKYVFSKEISSLYIIIADKVTPCKHVLGDVYPQNNSDFIIVPTEPSSFEPFIHVQTSDLRPITDYTIEI